MIKRFLGCAFAGLQFAAAMLAFTGAIVLGFAFISWGLATDPNWWFVAGRTALLVWVIGTVCSCMETR